MQERICSVVDCQKSARSRGWCSAHYERWRRNGVVGTAADARRRPVAACSVDGCDFVGRLSRGWCDKHYQRWAKYGDPTYTKRPDYGHTRRVDDAGYVQLWRPDHPMAMAYGYVLEHRMIAWDLGILADPDDHVHHINHDRQDNRPANLVALTPREHMRQHIADADYYIVNQYGRFPMSSGVCVIDGCERERTTRGWCNRHYLRWRRHGDPLGSATQKPEAT